MSWAISRRVVSLPPDIVSRPSTPSRSRWSTTAWVRLTSRVSATAPAFSSWNSGRTPAQTRSARASRNPGTRRSPSSSIWSTSSCVTGISSGSAEWMSVVPITLTVRIGTRMSPSAGMVQRLITVFTSRWFMAIMMPLPGTTPTPSIPAMCAICAAQAPEALIVNPASMSSSSPVSSLRTRAPATAAPSRCRAITRW